MRRSAVSVPQISLKDMTVRLLWIIFIHCISLMVHYVNCKRNSSFRSIWVIITEMKAMT